ncbi:MAG: acetylornithine deacetylase/succinyl-diaminopimelate desuccinylase-like protein [Candidatus Poriferisodalaceae bacterium]|jgi:acetylornithine deacetylase/succinyl-diaminopimelate desuccinylase-like protein
MATAFEALDLAERVGDLVRIPSVNPEQTGPKSNSDGERSLASWLAERTADMGADVTVDDVVDGRCNVYATFPGKTERSLCVDVHLDTVGVEHMTNDPFDGRIEDGRVYGRGSVDTKATLALALAAIEEIHADGQQPGPTITVVGTISEEAGGLIGAAGHRDWLLAQGRKFDRMIVAEPTICRPVHGHKGGLGLEVTVLGHAAHSSKPHLGKNAISGAARIITAIDAENERLAAVGGATAMGPGTISVNEVGGGLARNIIPDCCTLYAGRRTAPGEDSAAIHLELEELIRQAAAPLLTEIELINGSTSDAFYTNPDSGLVRDLCELTAAIPELATYGTNALRYGEVAYEIVVFGPGNIDQAHQAVEWVDISELAKAADVYRRMFRAS